jgi:uncharacterized integral membrane protein
MLRIHPQSHYKSLDDIIETMKKFLKILLVATCVIIFILAIFNSVNKGEVWVTLLLIFVVCPLIIILGSILIAKYNKHKKIVDAKKDEAKKLKKGDKGESAVINTLDKCLTDNDVLLNNIMFRDKNVTYQIDHLVVSIYGLCFIETKNFSGRLYCNLNHQYWTQVLAFGNRKEKVFNPILQSKLHQKHLMNLLKLKYGYDYIVAVNNDLDLIKNNCKEKVFFYKELPQYFQNRKKIYFRKEEVTKIVKKIEYIVQKDNISSEEHRELTKKRLGK